MLNNLSFNPNLNVMIAIAASLALASAITLLIEKPALNLIRKWYKRFQQPRYVTAPAQAWAE